MKHIKLISLVLALILAFSSCTFALPDFDSAISADISDTSFEVPDDDSDRVYFSDIEYKRPDFAEMAELRNSITDAVEKNGSAENIKDMFEKYSDLFDYANSMYTLLEIYQSIDTTDEANTDEMNTLDELISAEYEEYIKLCTVISDSYCREEVLYDWTEEDFEILKSKAEYTDSEYTALTNQQTKLVNEYISRISSLTFEYKGKQYTFEEIYYNEDISDEDYQRILQEYNSALKGIAELYVDLVKVNNSIASKAGYGNYAEYAYENVYYRDFSTDDAKVLHALVKELIAPKIYDFAESFSQSEYYALSRYLYKDGMLESQKELIHDYLKEAEMYDAYSVMQHYGYIHIGNDAKMQSGAYTTYMPYYDVPFIYICTSGGYNDILTLMHEFGHFYPEYMLGEDCAEIVDVCEIQSQTNEFLFLKHFGALGDNAESAITKYQLLNAMLSLTYGCLYDEFQQVIYEGDYSTPEEIDAVFLKLCDEYCIEGESYEWVDVLHNFQVPMYYISYAVSVVPALEIYFISNDDRQKAFDIYHKLLSAESDLTFNDVLEDIGLESPFERKTIETLCDRLEQLFN